MLNMLTGDFRYNAAKEITAPELLQKPSLLRKTEFQIRTPPLCPETRNSDALNQISPFHSESMFSEIPEIFGEKSPGNRPLSHVEHVKLDSTYPPPICVARQADFDSANLYLAVEAFEATISSSSLVVPEAARSRSRIPK